MAGVLDGRVAATPLEAALATLIRKAHVAPARLAPADLAPVRALAGDGALEYALVLGTFHFINRIADLLHVDPELPGMAWLRRLEPVRRRIVRTMAVPLRRMDLAPRAYPRSFDGAAALLPPHVDRAALGALRPRPHLVEALALAHAEAGVSSLPAEIRARIDRTVEAALPASPEDAEGFHPRPVDPVEAFAFVGTRYAYRTTPPMIEALRARGFDDLGILDLAIAVSAANEWTRLGRLLELPPAVTAATPV